MTSRQFFLLLLLAALWGASFLFTRVAAPEFGVIPLVALRVGIAAIALLLILLWKKRGATWSALTTRPGLMLVPGILNSALPFCLISYALLTIPSSIGSILNAATPMSGAIIAFFWLGENLTRSRILGLVLGFVGVFVLVSEKLALQSGHQTLIAMGSSLLATVCYGYAANYTRKYLQGVDALVTATGSQIVATLSLLPLAIWLWPATSPSLLAWINLLFLGVISTGLAFIIFFDLIKEIGAARATTVTFLIPVFGTSWGMLFLGEKLTLLMLSGAAIIIAGTALSSGFLKITGLDKPAKPQTAQ